MLGTVAFVVDFIQGKAGFYSGCGAFGCVRNADRELAGNFTLSWWLLEVLFSYSVDKDDFSTYWVYCHGQLSFIISSRLVAGLICELTLKSTLNVVSFNLNYLILKLFFVCQDDIILKFA